MMYEVLQDLEEISEYYNEEELNEDKKDRKKAKKLLSEHVKISEHCQDEYDVY